MSARMWATGDPEPIGHPPLVDREGVTWMWDPYNDIYERQKVTHYPHPDGTSPGAVLGSPVVDWDDLLGEFGPVREATESEARTFIEAWAAKPIGANS